MRKGHLDVKELEKYKKEDIQALAKELGVSTEGTIKEIAARIAEVEVELPDDEDLEDDSKDNDGTSEDNTTNEDLVKVKAIQGYNDKQFDKYIEKDTEFEVDKNRANVLITAKVAKLV